ncbi:MAG: hypothetical protein M1813_005567 [Trichoglossum hirsutum]|nr:MAG: hypothetical protein M1813_005567 [Trichoglossum hirsutum]
MNPSSSRRKGSSDETAPMSDSGSSSAGTSKTHRPILLSAADVARADGDAGFVDLSSPIVPPLRSFAIEASHPVIQSWPLIRARILTILDQSRIRWSSLGVLRRRQILKQEDDDTTVVLVVQKGNNIEIVERVEEGIYQACRSTGNPDLFVEVLVGGVIRFGETEYEVKAFGGSSISPTEVDYSVGTLGGYVRLMGPNGSRVLAVSCHHVIMPAPLNTPSEYTEAVAPGLGHHIRVSQPGVMAREEDISAKRKVLLLDEGSVKELQEEVEYKPWKARNLEVAENSFRISGNELKKALDFDHHFGTVFATSGYKISTTLRCALDWALVDVQYTRRGENKVPELERAPPGYQVLSEGDAVVGVAQLSMDDYVVKAGYSSGTTYGWFSHIKHDCNLPGNSSLTSEYVIAGHKGRPFALRGDSGAFVLNRHGNLAGLLIAGHEELGIAYVTPMTEVMRDIQQVTGHQVTLP